MTEEKTAEQGAAKDGAAQQQFLIQRIYLKDLSFESPMGAKVFAAQLQPEVGQELSTEATKIADDLYETVLKFTITAKVEDDTAFLVEVQQAGLFMIKGVEGEDLSRVLNTMCPQIIFPYARETIDNALTRGNFPPVMLPPVNFDLLYARTLEEQNQKEQKAH